MHGDEIIPVIGLTFAKVPNTIANPQALIAGKRFIDTDMNEIFGTNGNTNEHKNMKILLKKIKKNNLVVDFHTCSAKTEPFAIVVDKDMIQFASTSGLKKIVFMKINIKKGGALINFRKGFSVETGNHKSYEAFKTTIKVAQNVNSGFVNKKYTVYEVYEIIDKPGIYLNFKKNKLGFYPILAGEKAYKIYGLKANIIANIKL